MKVIAVANQKGGCGKTTTALNVASCLARLNYRILLVDLDPQGHATYGLGVDPMKVEKSVYNALTSMTDKRTPIENTIVNIFANMDLMPSHILLSTIEQEFRDVEGAVSRLYDTFNSLNKPYDFIIIDCPPSLGFLTFNALRAAHLVIITVEPSRFSMVGINKLMNMIELIVLKLQHSPKIRALVTIYDKRTKFSQKIFEEIKKYFKDTVFKTVIRINVTLKEAAAAGIPIDRYNKRSNGAKDYTAIADEILKESKKLQIENFYKEAKAMLSRAKDAAVFPFTYRSTTAKEVYLVGDFNNWAIDQSFKLVSKNGVWEKRLELKPGRYRYKFLIDGQWATDPQNNQTEQNPFGSVDSVLTVTA